MTPRWALIKNMAASPTGGQVPTRGRPTLHPRPPNGARIFDHRVPRSSLLGLRRTPSRGPRSVSPYSDPVAPAAQSDPGTVRHRKAGRTAWASGLRLWLVRAVGSGLVGLRGCGQRLAAGFGEHRVPLGCFLLRVSLVETTLAIASVGKSVGNSHAAIPPPWDTP